MIRQFNSQNSSAHTALGDVQTVADLFANVLRPIAGHRGLDTWEKLAAERVKLLEKESAELEREADKLADEIKELSGEAANRIG